MVGSQIRWQGAVGLFRNPSSSAPLTAPSGVSLWILRPQPYVVTIGMFPSFHLEISRATSGLGDAAKSNVSAEDTLCQGSGEGAVDYL